jgi:hypothetical protein
MSRSFAAVAVLVRFNLVLLMPMKWGSEENLPGSAIPGNSRLKMAVLP